MEKMSDNVCGFISITARFSGWWWWLWWWRGGGGCFMLIVALCCSPTFRWNTVFHTNFADRSFLQQQLTALTPSYDTADSGRFSVSASRLFSFASSEGPMKRRSLASLHRSLSQKAHNESLHFCNRENASADYRQSSNSSSVFPSGRVSPHWPVPRESIDSALPGDGRDINNSRGLKEKGRSCCYTYPPGSV